jgi:hypothetical protein
VFDAPEVLDGGRWFESIAPGLLWGQHMLTGTFTLYGYRTRELDLVPALGLALVVLVVCLMAATL